MWLLINNLALKFPRASEFLGMNPSHNNQPGLSDTRGALHAAAS